MKSLLEKEALSEITIRINNLTENTNPKWGKMIYKHLDHHLTQFGV